MLRFAADENFNGRIVRGLLRLLPDLDLVRVQDTPLSGAEDPEILQWAAEEGRVVLTHDAETMAGFAYQRVQAGQAMPGVVEVTSRAPIGAVIESPGLHSCAPSARRTGPPGVSPKNAPQCRVPKR